MGQVYNAVFAEFMQRTEFERVAASALVRREKAGVTIKARARLAC